jgi:hypothetical protein
MLFYLRRQGKEMAGNLPSFSNEVPAGATMRPRYMGRTMTTYPVSEPEMDQISSLSGQVTARFAAASLLIGLAASIWTNAVFVNEMTPTGQLATYYVASIFIFFAAAYALSGYLARRKRASTWEKIKSGAEPVQTIAEARGLMLTGDHPVAAKRGGRN